MTLTYGSLFSGVGGFDLGFDQAGYECKWQAEWDKNCQQTLAHHWPGVPLYGDVREISGKELTPVDVITYGSPCQDLSVAGKRAGIDGGRSSMFFEATRIIKEMRDATAGTFPRITIWENVPGALSSNKGEDFRAVLTALDDIGAVAQWWNVLDAQYFGVPQRRRRVFVISVFDPRIAEQVGDREILAVGEGRRRNTPTRNKARKDPAPTIGSSIE
jgi:DNA (cytosine-5)-methyltransferase 1